VESNGSIIADIKDQSLITREILMKAVENSKKAFVEAPRSMKDFDLLYHAMKHNFSDYANEVS
jgi:hypothetical protein